MKIKVYKKERNINRWFKRLKKKSRKNQRKSNKNLEFLKRRYYMHKLNLMYTTQMMKKLWRKY